MAILRYENPNFLTFSGILTVSLILIYYLGGLFFYIFELALQISSLNINSTKTFILMLTFFLWIPIFSITLFVHNLPFSPIDFHFSKIKESLNHKLFFIISFPIFIISLYFEFVLIHFFFIKDEVIIILLVLTFDLFPLSIWILFTLFFWELFNGKGSSQFLNLIRSRKNYRAKNGSNNNDLNISRRLGVISFSLPFIILTTGFYLGYRFGLFIIMIFFSLAFDLLSFLLFLYYLNQFLNYKHYFVANKVNRIIFGEKDISETIAESGVGINFLILVIFFSYSLSGPGYDLNLGYLSLYIGNIIIFLITIWSNQIKSFLKLNKEEEDNFDYYL